MYWSFFRCCALSHNVVSFGALVTAIIATSGDEAYVMFSIFPLEALWITVINSILTVQIGTHPLLTASPAGYPLLKAAGVVDKKRS